MTVAENSNCCSEPQVIEFLVHVWGQTLYLAFPSLFNIGRNDNQIIEKVLSIHSVQVWKTLSPPKSVVLLAVESFLQMICYRVRLFLNHFMWTRKLRLLFPLPAITLMFWLPLYGLRSSGQRFWPQKKNIAPSSYLLVYSNLDISRYAMFSSILLPSTSEHSLSSR